MKNTIWFKPLSIEDLKDSAVNMDKNLGIEFTEIGDDYIIARMPVIEKTKQPYGILHGGASCVLAESIRQHCCCSIHGWIEKKYPVGIEINANHLSSPTEGFVYCQSDACSYWWLNFSMEHRYYRRCRQTSLLFKIYSYAQELPCLIYKWIMYLMQFRFF